MELSSRTLPRAWALTERGRYVCAAEVGRDTSLHCPECAHAVVLVRGRVRVAHFRHSRYSACAYYAERGGGGGGESVQHCHAKHLLARHLQDGRTLQITRACATCAARLPDRACAVGPGESVRLEHRLACGGVADVAVLAPGSAADPRLVLEVRHSHATRESARATEQWFELDAAEVVVALAGESSDRACAVRCLREHRDACGDCLRRRHDAWSEATRHTYVYFRVAYEEREAFKAVGGRWDPERRCWYVSAHRYCQQHLEETPWFPSQMACTRRDCRCRRPAAAVAARLKPEVQRGRQPGTLHDFFTVTM